MFRSSYLPPLGFSRAMLPRNPLTALEDVPASSSRQLELTRPSELRLEQVDPHLLPDLSAAIIVVGHEDR